MSTIQFLATEHEWDAPKVQEAWRRLMAASANPSALFQSPEWFQNKHKTKGEELRVAVVENDGTITAIVPLLLGRQEFYLRPCRMRFRTAQLLGGEGLPPNITLIKQGLETVAFGLPSTWAGWAAMDGLNRVFHGMPQVDAGIGHQTMDLTHNLPTGPYGYCCNARSKGFETNYRRIWGIKG